MKISIHSSQTGWDSDKVGFIHVKSYFNPLIPNGMRPTARSWPAICTGFQSTHPKRDETTGWYADGRRRKYFNPLIPNGMRRRICKSGTVLLYFNPLIPNGMRPLQFPNLHPKYIISIHSSQTGWDWDKDPMVKLTIQISIHSSQTGWDLLSDEMELMERRFQSTHPKRDETVIFQSHFFRRCLFQSTHPKRDETIYLTFFLSLYTFQSTHPKRDETARRTGSFYRRSISIHSSQTGWDAPFWLGRRKWYVYFNPLIPNGMRPFLILRM